MEGNQQGTAAEALVKLSDSVRKRFITGTAASPGKKSRINKSPKKSRTELTFSEEEPLEPDSAKRYSLRLTPGASSSSLTPTKSKKSRKQLKPKVLVVGSSLKNFLKFPKAHQWCFHEWFYSDIDKPLFEGENEFCQYLDELFPSLKTRNLHQVEWRQLRRLMGKPRRCSSVFFEGERHLLHERRDKIRHIQQGLVSDFTQYRDLPDNIPQSLIVGTKVIALLRKPHITSCYSGRVEAVQYSSNQYLVSFDRPGLGKHHVLDTEVKSLDPLLTYSISELELEQQKQWKIRSSSGYTQPAQSPKSVLPSPYKSLWESPSRDQILYDAIPKSPVDPLPMASERASYKLLILHLSRLVSSKQSHLKGLSHLNTLAEKLEARGQVISVDLQRQFAECIVKLDEINKQINNRVSELKKHPFETKASNGSMEDSVPSDASTVEARHEFSQTATAMMQVQAKKAKVRVKSEKVLNLITQMASILLQIESIANGDRKLDLSSLASSVQELGLSVSSENYKKYETAVEPPLRYILAGLNPSDNLHAFALSDLTGSTSAH